MVQVGEGRCLFWWSPRRGRSEGTCDRVAAVASASAGRNMRAEAAIAPATWLPDDEPDLCVWPSCGARKLRLLAATPPVAATDAGRSPRNDEQLANELVPDAAADDAAADADDGAGAEAEAEAEAGDCGSLECVCKEALPLEALALLGH